jgi:hypothetical protein
MCGERFRAFVTRDTNIQHVEKYLPQMTIYVCAEIEGACKFTIIQKIACVFATENEYILADIWQ